MKLASPGAARLLRLVARRLLYEGVLRAMGVACRISVLIALVAVGIHLGYTAIDPLAPAACAGVTFAIAIGWALLRRPSVAEAAAFIDRKLDGRCAYRTLLELEPPPSGPSTVSQAAVAAVVDWVESHAARGSAMLTGLAAPRRSAALAGAAVAITLASVILQQREVAGALGSARVASPAPDAAATATAQRRSLFGDDWERRGVDAIPEGAMKAVQRGGVPHQLEVPPSDAGAGANAKSHASHPLEGPASGNTAGRNGLAAGASRDSSLATQLSRTMEFAAIRRRTAGGASPSSVQSTGETLEATDPAGSGSVALTAAAAVPPPQDLTSTVSGPAERSLVTRYFSELVHHR